MAGAGKSAKSRGAGPQPGLALWLGLAVIVILLDQITKTLVIGSFELGDSRRGNGCLTLVRVHNTGRHLNQPPRADQKRGV